MTRAEQAHLAVRTGRAAVPLPGYGAVIRTRQPTLPRGSPQRGWTSRPQAQRLDRRVSPIRDGYVLTAVCVQAVGDHGPEQDRRRGLPVVGSPGRVWSGGSTRSRRGRCLNRTRGSGRSRRSGSWPARARCRRVRAERRSGRGPAPRGPTASCRRPHRAPLARARLFRSACRAERAARAGSRAGVPTPRGERAGARRGDHLGVRSVACRAQSSDVADP